MVKGFDIIPAILAVFVVNILYLPTVAFAQEDKDCRTIFLQEETQDFLKKINRYQNTSDENVRAIAEITEFLNSKDICPKDKATLLEARAGYVLKTEPVDYGAAVDDLEAAFSLNALGVDRDQDIVGLASFIYFAYGFYDDAERILGQIITRAEEKSQPIQRHTKFRYAASLYAQEKFSAAKEPAYAAVFQPIFEPEKSFFGILDSIYYELGENDRRQELYSAYNQAFPQEERYDFSAGQLPDVARIDASTFDILGIAQRNRNAVVERRFPPEYPDGCQNVDRTPVGENLRIKVRFDVMPTGKVDNARVVESDYDCLARPAIKAVQQWIYKPKLVNGEPVIHPDVETVFVFRLEE
ncbi:MAG: energy transducer TonB [Aquisalinus sp.]|nr:energy transducer TonB [Aquisalinus sp.]